MRMIMNFETELNMIKIKAQQNFTNKPKGFIIFDTE